jgi:mediator of RNA polymerase II transcription subunit 13
MLFNLRLNAKKELKSNSELTKCLKYMQPLLDEAIQRKHTSARLWENVQGPMTWQHFCRIAYRDVNSGLLTCNYEPEPIPALLVSSSEHDWLSVSPYAIKFWDKLSIEPYSKQKNIAYCVMCPDSDVVLRNVRKYFKEFNSTYELCRLGLHRPALRVSNDNGIMRVPFGNTKDAQDIDPDTESWLKQFKNQAIANKLKSYFTTFKKLSKIVKQFSMDSSLYEELRKPEQTTGTQQGSSQSQHGYQQNDVDFPEISPSHQDLMDNSSAQINNLFSNANNEDYSQNQYFGTDSNNQDTVGQQNRPVSSSQNASSFIQPHPQQQTTKAQTQSTFNLNLIVYIVDPFECTSDTSEDQQKLKRLIDLTLFNSYLTFLNNQTSEANKHRITFQIVPLNVIMDMYVYNDEDFKLNMLRSQAFNVFSLIKSYYMPQMPRSKNLTGFGPAAFDEKYLKENYRQNMAMQFYSPPFILAPNNSNNSLYKGTMQSSLKSQDAGASQPAASSAKPTSAGQQGQQTDLMKNVNKLSATSIGSNPLMQQFLQLNFSHYDQSNVLYVGYCLSDDQRYLLASCCDENGELVESTSINIQIAERHRRKSHHARRIGLRKLWEFIIKIISQTCKPWRLVVGRLGRLGHSELAGWGCLLSKKNLQRVCQQLKDTCESCNIIGNTEMPCILSACLVSMEKCSSICIYPESFSREDKTAAGLSLQANQHLQGVSCTHILTFPASAIIQTSVASSTKEDQNKDDFFDFFKFDDGENDLDLFVEESHNKGFNDSAVVDSDSNNLKEKVCCILFGDAHIG